MVVRNATFKLYIRKNFFVNNVFHVSTVNSPFRTNGLETRSCCESRVHVYVCMCVSVCVHSVCLSCVRVMCVCVCESALCGPPRSRFASYPCARLRSLSDTCDHVDPRSYVFFFLLSLFLFSLLFPLPLFEVSLSVTGPRSRESVAFSKHRASSPRCDLVLPYVTNITKYIAYWQHCFHVSHLRRDIPFFCFRFSFLLSLSLFLFPSYTSLLVLVHGTRTKKSPMYLPCCFTRGRRSSSLSSSVLPRLSK